VLLSLTLYINMKYPVSARHFPSILSLGLLQYEFYILTFFNIPALYRLSTFQIAI